MILLNLQLFKYQRLALQLLSQLVDYLIVLLDLRVLAEKIELERLDFVGVVCLVILYSKQGGLGFVPLPLGHLYLRRQIVDHVLVLLHLRLVEIQLIIHVHFEK